MTATMPMPLTADSFLALPLAERKRRFEALTDEEAWYLAFDWNFWARSNQLTPDYCECHGGKWVTWLILAGRGYGKTRTGAETVRAWVRDFEFVNLIGPTADDARDVMIEGETGILAICPDGERPIYEPSKRRLVWPNGAKSLIFTADEPERLRGKQHMKLWGDEPAAWRYADAWDQAKFGLRLGKSPQAVLTTTPKPTKLIRELIADPSTHVTRGTTYENRANLAPKFFSQIVTKYEGTRLGRQELNAEVLDDNPGALWTRTMIEAARVSQAPALARIVVAVDPAVTSNEDSDETGIIAAGMDERYPPHFYILDDKSLIGSPNEWGVAAVTVYHDRKADRVVGETNNGGEMIESTIRNVDANVSYRAVTASRGKRVRAEPIAALYEQGRVHHVGCFPELEDQLCDWNPTSTEKSPDRLDADVWAITELSEQASDGFLGFVRQEQQAAANKEPPCPTPASRSVESPWHDER